MDSYTILGVSVVLAFIIGMFIGKYAFPKKPCPKCAEYDAETKRLIQEANELSKGY